MAASKPAASLSPSLLARKGGAKPAMRPQFHSLPDPNEATARDMSFEDLGWNDMGEIDPIDPVAQLTAMPQSPAVADEDQASHDLGLTPMAGEVVQLNGSPVLDSRPAANSNSPVLDQHRKIAKSLVQPPVRRKSAFASGKRTAFTFRIDPDRHLKLRLASTISNRSAQQLMTEALDRLLDEMPELDALASKVRSSR